MDQSESHSSGSIQSGETYQEASSYAKPRPTIEETMSFIHSVQLAFGEKEFSQFVQLFVQLFNVNKDPKADLNVVQTRFKVLFMDHPNLGAGLNAFLPAGHEISIPVQKHSSATFHEAVNFVHEVKRAYNHDERPFKSFLEILNDYRRSGKITIQEVYKKVCILFQDKPHLIEKFCHFLPGNSTMEVQSTRLKD